MRQVQIEEFTYQVAERDGKDVVVAIIFDNWRVSTFRPEDGKEMESLEFIGNWDAHIPIEFLMKSDTKHPVNGIMNNPVNEETILAALGFRGLFKLYAQNYTVAVVELVVGLMFDRCKPMFVDVPNQKQTFIDVMMATSDRSLRISPEFCKEFLDLDIAKILGEEWEKRKWNS